MQTSAPFGLYSFVQTLLERPDLQKRVVAVEVGRVDGLPAKHESDARPTPRCIAEALDMQLHGRVFRFTGHSHEKRREAAEYSALVSVLLRLVLNLEHAHFCLPIIVLFEAHIQLVPSLAWLKSLAFSNLDRHFVLDIAAPIIRLEPNLEVLHCHDCVDVTPSFPTSLGRKTPTDPPPLQNLLELGLTNTSLTPADLRNLLSAVGPKLSKVDICRVGQQVSELDDDGEVVEFDEALAALRPWAETLRELLFLTSSRTAWRYLAHLIASTVSISSANSRPSSVWRSRRPFLTFTGPRPKKRSPYFHSPAFGGRLTPALQCLVRAYQAGQYPELRWIEIDDQGFEQFEPNGDPARELREVGDSFRSAGVHFVVCRDDHDDLDYVQRVITASSGLLPAS